MVAVAPCHFPEITSASLDGSSAHGGRIPSRSRAGGTKKANRCRAVLGCSRRPLHLDCDFCIGGQTGQVQCLAAATIYFVAQTESRPLTSFLSLSPQFIVFQVSVRVSTTGPIHVKIGDLRKVFEPWDAIVQVSSLGEAGEGVNGVVDTILPFAVIKTHQGLTICGFLLLPVNVLLLWFLAGRCAMAKAPIVPMCIYWLVPQLLK